MPQPEAPCRPLPASTPVNLKPIILPWLFASSLACASGDYATDLAAVYAGYQRLQAMRDACDTVLPESRKANAAAFAAWREDNRELVEDLQRRVAMMIRGVSRDDAEYARNLGKYEGAILEERQAYRQSLLAQDAAALRERCGRLAETLKGPDADLRKLYAAELETLRRQK